VVGGDRVDPVAQPGAQPDQGNPMPQQRPQLPHLGRRDPRLGQQVRAQQLRQDLVTAFNCIHHFDLGRFLTAVARVLRPDGQLFVYTRTPQQNARTIWGRYFPGFTEHEQRLHSQAAFRDAVRRTDGLKVVATQTFKHPRSSTVERLRAQAEGRHYSTFSLYTPDELRQSIATFLARLPSPAVSWVDEHLLVVARGSTAPSGRT
jgi:SAM-dependent methyltransferase